MRNSPQKLIGKKCKKYARRQRSAADLKIINKMWGYQYFSPQFKKLRPGKLER